MLRTRLFLNLLPFVAILLAMGVYSIVLFSRLANQLDVSINKDYRSILAAQAMTLSLAGMDKEIWGASMNLEKNTKEFEKQQKIFEDNLESQLRNTAVPGEKVLNDELAGSYAALKTAVARLATTRRQRNPDSGYLTVIVPLKVKIDSLLDRIRNLNHEAILASSQSIRGITHDVTRLMVIGTAVALVISAFACYWLSTTILQPIQSLTKATRELGEGKLDQRVMISTKDELGDLALAFNRMAAQLMEYRESTTEKIVQVHRTMETTLGSFPDPIFVLNNAGAIELQNPAAAELATSLNLNGTLPPKLQTIAQQALQTGDSFLPHSFNEGVGFRLRGADKFYLPRIVAMRNKTNALQGVAVVLYDVTRFRLLDAAKSNLVATVSHELKSPLTSVRMVLHILLEKTVGPITARQEELLVAARDDAERLLRILNDLLDLARLEEGNAQLHRQRVAPAELVEELVAEMADKAAARNLKLEHQIEPNLPMIQVDRDRMRYVLSNLITNAIKYSPLNGEIILRAARWEGNDVQFSVSDQGSGIPEEYQQRIFDRFFRIPGQKQSGAGLGLSIAREIAVAHGGRIGLKNLPGCGCTFFVILDGFEGR